MWPKLAPRAPDPTAPHHLSHNAVFVVVGARADHTDALMGHVCRHWHHHNRVLAHGLLRKRPTCGVAACLAAGPAGVVAGLTVGLTAGLATGPAGIVAGPIIGLTTGLVGLVHVELANSLLVPFGPVGQASA